MKTQEADIMNPVATACGAVEAASLHRRKILQGAMMLSLINAAGGIAAWTARDRIVIRNGWVLLESDLA